MVFAQHINSENDMIKKIKSEYDIIRSNALWSRITDCILIGLGILTVLLLIIYLFF
jgi:hypothetical protein